jgi:isopenicillin N synthase-like dioxygenase
MNVLTVDYRSPNAAEQFSTSLKETGFAVLTHHPVPAELINKVYQDWETFFQSDDKFNYKPGKLSQQGYFPFLSENAKDNKISDLKEFYHYYPNGPVPANLKAETQDVYDQLSQFSSVLLQWVEDCLPTSIAKYLTMPLRDMITDSPNTLLRILHYPPLPSNIEPGAVRAAAHEDINLITILPAATAPGLEVLDTRGKWHEVTCDPGNIVVNVGDMLQMCTQHYYKSTTHRVTNPIGPEGKKSRYSMPLFLHPRSDVRLSEEYTAHEFLTERLRQIGIY